MAPSGMSSWPRRLSKTLMKSHAVKHDIPIRLRPWFMAFTCLVMALLAFLGFTNFARALPLNDKVLHFLCFGLATAVFYFIIDVEDQARRIWFWKYSALICTASICTFCGGIMSEFIQSALPYKEFDGGDIVANLLGSSLGLFIAYHLERYYRRRKELARLYRPLNADYSDDEEDVFSAGTVLLPTHTGPPKTPGKNKSVRFADVWTDRDEAEEVFDIGRDSDDEDDVAGPSQQPTSTKSPSPASNASSSESLSANDRKRSDPES